MKNIIVLISCFIYLTLSTPALGDWTGCRIRDNDCINFEIEDIFKDVARANKVLDKNKPVMNLFLDQQAHWKAYEQNAKLITEGVEDIFGKLPIAREKFLSFTGQPKCGVGTPCYNFQTDLIIFFNELEALKPSFPALERAGLQDIGAIRKAIMNMPPFILYAMYRAQKNIPKWQKLPADLKEIYDELADPEIFELDLNRTAKPSVSTAAITGSSAFGASSTTQQFCAQRANRLDGAEDNRGGSDQVRINRIILTVTLLTDVWKFALDQVPDDVDIGVSIVGEGGVIGIPSAVFTWFFKIVPLASESILKAIEVHHKNLDLCKSRYGEIESRLASCDYRTDFVLDGTARQEYYALVQRRFDMAFQASVPYAKADFFRDKSRIKVEAQQYKQAFELLCESYQNIGVAR